MLNSFEKSCLLAAVGLAIVALVVSVRTAASDTVSDAGKLENGKEIFEEYCAPCHGFDGIKMVPKAPSFSLGEGLSKTDEELLKTIKEGRGDIMPPWGEDLNEEEMKNVLAYVRTFFKKAE